MAREALQRKNWIDAAKAIAILIVVLNHSGIVIPGISFWGGMFYVPSFFLLAGYTYTRREESCRSFVKRKAKRLLIPYFAANGSLFLFFFCKELLTGGLRTEKTLLSLAGILYGRTQLFKSEGSLVIFEAPIQNVGMMLNLNAPTWFLPALFLVLICADGMFRLMKDSDRRVYLLTAVFAGLMLVNQYLSPLLMPWCLDILPYLLAFFLIGYALKERQGLEWLDRQKAPVKCAVIGGSIFLTAVSGIYNGSFNLSISYFGKSVAVCLICATFATLLLLLFLSRLDEKATGITACLAAFSKHNLAILCYHYFVMQMFFTLVQAVYPGIWEETGALPALTRLAGIVLSIGVCVAGNIGYHKIRKLRRRK